MVTERRFRTLTEDAGEAKQPFLGALDLEGKQCIVSMIGYPKDLLLLTAQIYEALEEKLGPIGALSIWLAATQNNEVSSIPLES